MPRRGSPLPDSGRERRHRHRREQEEHRGLAPDGRPAQEDLGAGVEGRQLARDRLQVPRRRARALRRWARTRAPSTTSPRRSSARKARAAATTRRARTTTLRCAASPASRALSSTSASPTSPRTVSAWALGVDGGDGCVEPSVETVQDGSYKPLAALQLRERGRDRRRSRHSTRSSPSSWTTR